MEQRWLRDKKMILTGSDLSASEDGEYETIILRHANLEQSDIEVITKKFAYATYLDLSYNERIAFINFLLTPTTLYLRNCTGLRDITYRFPTCTLKHLDIVGCSIDLEDHFHKYEFPMLESLTLNWQPSIKWRNLLGKMGSLQRLTIESICRQGAKSCRALLETIAEYKNIKAITFCGLPSAEEIVQLSKLTDIELGFRIRNGAENSLSQLCGLQNLHTLYLEHTTSISNTELLTVIKTCPNLRKITLDYCDGVTKEFIFKAAEFLRERDKYEPLKARFNLELCGCANIVEDILADPLYASAESAMSLIVFFKCKYAVTDYRNDLLIPYPAPNVQLSIYILFEIFKKLKRRSHSQAFATVCVDFENAAIEEERHLKIISCRKAKIVNNRVYDAYMEITAENNNFFKNRMLANATKMELSNRIFRLETIFEDFPKLRRLKLLNCAINESGIPRNKQFKSVRDLEIWGENALRLWQTLAMLFPRVTNVNLTYATWESRLNAASHELLISNESRIFEHLRSVTTVGLVLNDEDLNVFTQLINLNSFCICRNPQITGKYISDLRSIEELQVTDCANFKQYYLADILRCLALKSLNISDCPLAYTSAHLTNEMWLQCETLSKLKIDWQQAHTIIALQTLNTLVDLDMRGCEANYTETWQHQSADQQALFQQHVRWEQRLFHVLLERTNITKLTLEAELLRRNLDSLQLLQHLTHLSAIAIPLDVIPTTPNFYQTIGRLANLEYLHLANFFYCYDGIIHIVGKCPKLKEVRLSDCVGFSDFAIYELVEVVKRKRRKEQLPLCLFLHNSRDESGDTCSEESSASANDVNKRFEDVQEFIEVTFVDEPKSELSTSSPPFLDEVMCFK
ncbi:PREDICTED: uncharacterized protein LOC108364298 isoform X2 [Rhagoletis zephyria]|uniref:uncharacterized protein LOC108364298 isoform X2 n=1 Tax=Rhagoletis zephyria TaxID=28612 RepID=UPI0008119943|nr:PREDICTED: uncharacterized protein LOC108364298 isoform X2 [Rhagoletis zephyria]